MAEEKLTAKTLVDKGIKVPAPSEALRGEILERLDRAQESSGDRAAAMQSLYPNTLLDTDALETVTTALLSGANILFYGPSGSGKTTLAKDIWALFPKRAYVVDGCPVHDSPYSIFDEKTFREQPPCPFCRARFGSLGLGELGDFQPSKIDPVKIPVRLTMLQEGSGYARVQGSAEIFPDNLTGTLNLRKLEELGDPTSPLVLEPGKLLQANRGVFIADEIGKLPVGTQNVLLQALQENIVSPAKSRETFPAAFMTVTTSNLDDLDNITGPLNARLVSIYVGYCKDHAKNRRIVDLAIGRREHTTVIPSFLVDCDVHLIEEWRRLFGEVDGSEVGSNRTLLDIAFRSEARALLGGKGAVSLPEFRDGATEALTGRIWAGAFSSQPRDKLQGFIGKNLDRLINRSAVLYWCKFYNDVLKGDKSEGKRVVDEMDALLKDPAKKDAWASGKAEYKKAEKWASFVAGQEKFAGGLAPRDLAAAVYAMVRAAGTFDGELSCQ